MSEHPLAAKDTIWLHERVEEERARRLTFHGGWHYWSAAGRDVPTLPEHWCDYCAGWFGVPHRNMHDETCRYRFREHLCACIDCWCFQERSEAAVGGRHE